MLVKEFQVLLNREELKTDIEIEVNISLVFNFRNN